MTLLYDEAAAQKSAKLRKKLLIIYIAAFAVVFVVEAALIIYHATNYYNYAGITAIRTTVMVLGGVFAAASCVYLCLPYARANNYDKFVRDAINGEKIPAEVTVISVDKTLTVKYGVEYFKLNVLEWSQSSDEYVRRTVLVDNEKNDLEFTGGEILNIETYSNVLTAYKRIAK